MRINKFWKLVISVVVAEGAGIIGSVFTAPAIGEWYKTLQKPAFNPPSWVFAPVWTILFLLIGISFWLVWIKNFGEGRWQKQNIVIIFWVQLLLNVLWSLIFFGLHKPGLAFFELLMLWFSILFMIVNFYRISKTAAYLLLPYILWVTFAGILNYHLWILNL